MDASFANRTTCFSAFDLDRDDKLSATEFEALCVALFRNDDTGKNYSLSQKNLTEVFNIFDKNQDGFIDNKEFEKCWSEWIRVILKPISALMVVDVQNDFISGTLACSDAPSKHDGNEVIEPINNLIEAGHFDEIFYSLDWHPVEHSSFLENIHLRPLHPSTPTPADKVYKGCDVVFDGEPPFEMRLWPRHCIEDSWGAELHADLRMPKHATKICKAYKVDVDSYSAFWDNRHETQTDLDAQLRSRGVTDVFTCGIAYDYCVGSTAVDAIKAGYRTYLIEDASRGVDLDGIETMKQKIINLGGIIINSTEVPSLVSGRDRRPEMGYQLALELKYKI